MVHDFKQKIAAFAIALSLAVPATTAGIVPALAQPNGPVSVADLAEGLLGAVVNISTSQKVKQRRPKLPIPQVPEGSPFQEFFDDLFPRGGDDDDGPTRNRQSLGSGFVISADGLIITNNHVIADADEIVANFADGSKLVAEIVGTDPKTDIAVLRVKPDGDLAHVDIGDSEKSRIGDWVMAIGNPFGLGGSVSMGIVSAIGRDINSGPYDNFIQTDAAINRGNSGGPLFNMEGDVIGINTAIISPSGGSIGIGFAIPTALAKPVIDQLIEFGETRRGWLGVQIQLVSEEIAESLGLDEAKGALVGDVFKDGPADKAGIQSGDIVLSFDGKEVETMRDLPKIVADTPVGESVDVVLFRKGEKQTVQVEVGRLEEGEKAIKASKEEDDDKKSDSAKPVLGMMLQELDDALRDAEGVAAEVKGVYVLDVAEGTSAEDKGIEAGNVIVEVNQEPVATPQDVSERVEELKKSGRKNALLMIANKEGDIRFVVVRIES
ncbi:DegQ family serine endoprotease [Salaquimonas pukyongi]|uniref:DegQ family serine endoprotease n=1 Tax=Salaquimonas pukyongi TaxID=2712698 RepID=UPI00096BC385|nr:DegQ family serine endoprotease [Salaquimonas pukyongi]